MRKQEYQPQFRHELKYVVSVAQLAMIRNRINHMIPLDLHSGENRAYTIRSLYFDDYCNKCFYENENGIDPREKFRIRIYNQSLEKISLECKRKENGKTLKMSCPLTIEQTKNLMNGKTLTNIREQHPLLQRLTAEMLLHKLRPVVIVEYKRSAYVYKYGNVRITLDTEIETSSVVSSFLDKQISKRPVMPVGQHLLEVKFDEYLPDFIYRNLQLQNLRQTAYSKYYICRKFAY